MEIILPIGISGSGKSTYYDTHLSQTHFLVSPDKTRQSLTGNISDQTRNKEVFELVKKEIQFCVDHGMDIYYDATNINTKYRREFTNSFKDNQDVTIRYFIFPANVELSNERIRKDIENSVNRSDVPYDVLEKQLKLYKESVFSGFKDEHVKEIRYLF